MGALLVAAALAAGCDTAPGVDDIAARPPVVRDLAFSPSVVDVESAEREGESAVVSMSISAQASDADNDLASVGFVIQAPIAQAAPVFEGQLEPAGGGRFAAEARVAFPAALTGPYVLIVYAVDERGILGNELRGTIELTASSNPPVIEEIEMPDRVQRPAAGQAPVPIQLIARVSDPDGLGNVARVEVQFDGQTTLRLCDDGAQGACNPGFGSGDAVAGDGRFTLTIQIDSNNSPGDRTLVFRATDRSGLTSEPVTRVLTIE